MEDNNLYKKVLNEKKRQKKTTLGNGITRQEILPQEAIIKICQCYTKMQIIYSIKETNFISISHQLIPILCV